MRDKKLWKIGFFSNINHRYGLQFRILNNYSQVFLCILLSGDIATNPGPNNHFTYQPHTGTRTLSAKCLVIKSRSLVSFHKSNGKQSCHLSKFQELVYSEEADLVCVTETWLKNDIDNAEILPSEYTIYRKDRNSRAGGVLLAVKSCSFSNTCEVKFDLDLELVAVEIISHSNMKYLLACCYKSQQYINCQWVEKFNLFLAKTCSQYSNVLICGDFNFPKIHWDSPELTTGGEEVDFMEMLSDYHLTQLNSLPTRGENILDLVITNVPNLVDNISVVNPGDW
jgi:hypothetical protein